MRSRLLCLLSLLLLPSLAVAFSSSTSANQTTFGGFTATPSNVSPYTVSTASDGRVLVSSGARIPLAGGGSFPINVAGSVARPSAAAAIGRFLLKGSGVIGVLGVGVAAYELAQDLGYTLDNSSGSTAVTFVDPSSCTVAPCFMHRVPANTGPDRGTNAAAACQSYVAGLVNPPYAFQYVGTTYPQCFYQYRIGTGAWTGGFTEMSRTSTPPVTGGSPSSIAALEAAIAANNGWSPDSPLADAWRAAVLAGDSGLVQAPVVTGPATVPGASSTTVDDATGETTTTTQTVNNTYEGDKVTTTITTTTLVTNTATGAPIRQSVKTESPVAELPVSPNTETPPFAMPCGVAGTPPCGVKVDELGTPVEVPADKFKPMLDEGKQAQEDLLDQVKSDADKSFFEPFTDLFVTPALASCVPLEIPGDRGVIDPCGTVDGARAIMAYIWALSGLALCLHMVRSAL